MRQVRRTYKFDCRVSMQSGTYVVDIDQCTHEASRPTVVIFHSYLLRLFKENIHITSDLSHSQIKLPDAF